MNRDPAALIAADRHRPPVVDFKPHDAVRRIGFVIVVLGGSWAGDEFGADGPASFWFEARVAGIPLPYLALVGVLALASPWIIGAPRVSVAFRLRRLRMWHMVVLAWLAIAVSLFLGIVQRASELFADWRNIVVICLVACSVARWLANERWKGLVLVDLAVGIGLAALLPLIRWVGGGGSNVFSTRTPVFELSRLFLACYSAIVLTGIWAYGLSAVSKARGVLIRTAAISSSLLVLLSFRRTFWITLVVGIPAMMWLMRRRGYLRRRRLLGIAAVAGALVAVTLVSLGPEKVWTRIGSINPGTDRMENEFSVSNPDHLNDIIDAVRVIGRNPLFGFGIGRFYQTQLIQEWKTTSFEVHDPFVHVWLKFGLLGLVAYAGYYWSAIRAFVMLRRPSVIETLSVSATGVFLGAELVGNALGTWLEGSVKSSVFLGVLVGSLIAIAEQSPQQHQQPRTAPAPVKGSAGGP